MNELMTFIRELKGMGVKVWKRLTLDKWKKIVEAKA
jgi:hypothetical protein